MTPSWPDRFEPDWNILGLSVAFASNREWPDATNTGVPDDTPLQRSDGLVITTPGTVVSKVDVHGSVHIKAADVTLEKCRVTSNGWAVVQIESGITGTVVQDCTINGTGAGPDGTGNQGIMGQGTFLRNNISNVENGITLTGNNSVIEDNYIHDLKAGGEPHYDGIEIDGAVSDVVIRHNTIINSHGAAAAIMIDNYFGPISNITVDNNLLAGGSFTIYSDAKFNSSPIAGVTVSNNHIAPGQYGPKLFRGNSPTYTGNSYDGAAQLRGVKLEKGGPRQ
ncbi:MULTISPECIES: right-handed parallel beta-helix repeat-containing protein [unclassified Bradyrhizobium]|uniref:right-handed parallel beta-helix repeat-containing protein n=1 Tax=unclassified Bradyrhizobium TaxID=2631580 RepID=UPI001FFC11E1|nr:MULTISPECIES: right-handed parallel beta-helix repeat-containing protein [unclassified Bradyrhizobium]MCK1328789.1 right-handed parallel beta-helix repeat-containing protein [Bradyrhizobium sp. CW9]MCK1693435.1 right-handed parallel beta-helix repeat-containing protein [Bradyrhizobium sp. 144]